MVHASSDLCFARGTVSSNPALSSAEPWTNWSHSLSTLCARSSCRDKAELSDAELARFSPNGEKDQFMGAVKRCTPGS